MTRHLTALLVVFTLLTGAFAGFIAFIDPYDVVGGPRVRGLNAEKTRTHEDGARVTASHRLLTTSARAALLGNSRVVDGFPDDLSGWPGGMINAGMRGSNAFEIARAAVVAGQNPAIECLVIGVDLDDFSAHGAPKATYWISTLPDASRLASLVRVSLSPSAFARALQTLDDNVTGAREPPRWRDAYAPGWQREDRFDASLEGTFAHYRGFEYDPERMAFFVRALEGLNAAGVQTVVYLHPLYASREEAMVRAGARPDHVAMRAALARAEAAAATPEAPGACATGPMLQVWDFSGFEPISTVAPPGPAQAESHPYWHEPAHYAPAVGAAMLDRLAGRTREGLFAPEGFGARLDDLDALEAAAMARRETWITTDAYGRWTTARLDALAAAPAPPPNPARAYLTRDDHARLARDLARAQRRRTER